MFWEWVLYLWGGTTAERIVAGCAVVGLGIHLLTYLKVGKVETNTNSLTHRLEASALGRGLAEGEAKGREKEKTGG